MNHTNSVIKKRLLANGFDRIYCFPHLRFQKDYILGDMGFDAIGWKLDNKTSKKECCLFQFKTGNIKLPLAVKKRLRMLETRYFCRFYWVNRVKGKVFMYSATNEDGVELV